MTFPVHSIKDQNLKKQIQTEVESFLKRREIFVSLEEKSEIMETMYRTLKFNATLTWEENQSVSLVRTPKELIEIYQLRSQVYTRLGYDKEFPEMFQGLNFDHYDENSAILYTQKKGKITGTCRVIFDTVKKLPIDKNFSLDFLRTGDKTIAELSRLMIEKTAQNGLGKEFKYLTSGVYHVMVRNKMTTLVSVMTEEHFPLYEKFGGFEKKASLSTYGDLPIPFIITAWEVSKASTFFKRVFLSIRE